MIKLKKLLESHHTVVVGYISMDGIIHSEETTNTHFGLNFHRGKCWRFNPYNDILYWHGDWSEHNEVDEINVATHLLKKYEYKVKKNITLEETEYTDYVSHFNNAHGLHENVSQNDITNRIKILEAEWERLDSQGTGHVRQMEIQREIEKLWSEAEHWKHLKQTVDNAENKGITNCTRSDTIYEASSISPLLLGAIWPDGEIKIIKGEDEHSRHPFNWSACNKFRYMPDIKYLFWWERPSDRESELVKDKLSQYGYTVNKVGGMLGWRENINENKKLVMEGQQEKSAEDFIKQSIRGTEWENKVFACGGYVRDQISGHDAKDLDIVVDAPNGGISFSNWITKKIGNYKTDSNPVIFPKFGTSKFNLNGVVHNGIDLTGFEIEAVMPRTEQYTAGSRKPEVQQSNLKGDALRRDTTFNSLFKNISTGEILDLTGKGKEDLEKGIIRTPIDPDKTFIDDPLRTLRIVRFYAKYGYDIPLYIIKSMKRNAAQLQNISSERIQAELNKMLVTTRPEKALKLLKITGLLDYIIPEFKLAYKMGQNIHHSQTVFDHSLSVLSKTEPKIIQRLIGMCHDIGKVVTKTITPTGVHFIGHEIEGEKIVRQVMKNLKYPTEMIDAVALGVKSHMRLKHGGDDAVKISDKTLRKFKLEMGEHLDDILSVIHADNICHAEASSMPNQVAHIKERLKNLDIQVSKPNLPINGNDLIGMGVPKGPIFTNILSAITDAWYENPNITKEEAIQIVRNIIKK